MFKRFEYTRDSKGYKESIAQLSDDDVSALFNPLMGISPKVAHIRLPIFRHFDFKPENLRNTRKGKILAIRLCSDCPFTGSVEKKLKPHLGGSWENLKVSRIPMATMGCYRASAFQVIKICDFSFGEEGIVMGDLVDKLNTWYRETWPGSRMSLPYETPLHRLRIYAHSGVIALSNVAERVAKINNLGGTVANRTACNRWVQQLQVSSRVCRVLSESEWREATQKGRSR
jgi:hypothetical protein